MSKPKSLLFLIIAIVVLLMPINNPLTHAGILNPWAILSSTPLPKPLYLHSSVVSNGNIYVLGGISSTSSDSIYAAKINSDGTLGTWDIMLPLPNPNSGLSTVASDGYIFFLGGKRNNITVLDVVFTAKIKPDGTLEDWTLLCMTPLPKELELHASVLSNGYIFVMGGASNSNLHESAVYSAKVNPNGTLGAWTTLNSTPLPKGLKNHSAVSSNGYIFVLGGESSSSNAESTVYSAKVNSDGTLGAWTELNSTPLPQGLYSHSSVASNDYIFVMGGALNTGSIQSTVYAAKVNSDGTLGSWTTLSSAPLPKAISLFPSVIESQYIFVLGGQSDSLVESAVYSTKIDDQGPISSNGIANPNPSSVNTPITLTVNVNDSQTGDSIITSAEYNIDGSNYSSMSAQDGSFNNTTEDVTATIPAFGIPAVYTVCARGSDRAGNVGNEDCIFLPIYDPNGGFVTGGGWIYSQPGSYMPNQLLEGKATFGFVSKYKKDANIPTGSTQFDFRVANLNFHSDTYEWLVLSGARAQFKGTGTINGIGNYGFMLTAIDSDVNGGGDVDRFRIKIWNKDDNDTIVYDNEAGLNETGDPATPVEGGSIIIHK